MTFVIFSLFWYVQNKSGWIIKYMDPNAGHYRLLRGQKSHMNSWIALLSHGRPSQMMQIIRIVVSPNFDFKWRSIPFSFSFFDLNFPFSFSFKENLHGNSKRHIYIYIHIAQSKFIPNTVEHNPVYSKRNNTNIYKASTQASM